MPTAPLLPLRQQLTVFLHQVKCARLDQPNEAADGSNAVTEDYVTALVQHVRAVALNVCLL